MQGDLDMAGASETATQRRASLAEAQCRQLTLVRGGVVHLHMLGPQCVVFVMVAAFGMASNCPVSLVKVPAVLSRPEGGFRLQLVPFRSKRRL